MKYIRFAALLLLLCAVLAACGSQEEPEETVYEASYTGLDERFYQLYSVDAIGDRIYVLGVMQFAMGEEYLVKILDRDGTELQTVFCEPAMLPEIADGWLGGNSTEELAADSAGNLWLFGRQYSYCAEPETLAPGVPNTRMELSLTKIDTEGTVLAAADLDELLPELAEGFQTVQLFCAGDSLCLLGNGQLYIFDSEGTMLSTVDAPVATATGDGGIVAVLESSTPGQTALRRVDPATGGLGDALLLDGTFSFAYPGEGDTVYLNDQRKLYQCDLAGGALTEVLTWNDTDMTSGYIQQLTALEDGGFAALGTGLYNFSADLILLTPVPASQAAARTILRLATVNASQDLKTAAVQFNRANPDYKIKIVEYTDFDSQSAITSALLTEITLGEIPDLIDFTYLPPQLFINAGLMTDLYPWLEQDETLSAEGILPSVLKAEETDGALYQLPRYILPIVLAAPADLVPAQEDWTLEALYAIVEENPQFESPFGKQYGRSIFLRYILYMSWDCYMDLDQAACFFDTEEFCRLLEFIKQYLPPDEEAASYISEDSQWTGIRNGEQLFYFGELSGITLQILDQLYEQDAAFPGFPSSAGGQNAFQPVNSLGMTEACQYKEIAWEFLRQLYLDAAYKENFFPGTSLFPTNLTTFTRLLDTLSERKTEIQEDGTEIEKPILTNTEDVTVYALTASQRERLETLFGSIDTMMLLDATMVNIVLEEVPAFFAGDKTAEETAAIIQNRVGLYLAEQYG